jgi:hypothetical protein
VSFHQPLTLGGERTRKHLAAHAEAEVRQGLVRALHRAREIG